MGQTFGEQVMSKSFRAYVKASAAILVGFGAVAYATSAAACGSDALAQPASFQDGQSMGRLLHQADMGSPGDHSIVGMWSFRMSGGGFSDFGYQQWHSDGTELMNSGGRAPATQNYCLGVWRQVAPSRYHLNHFALSYNASTGQLDGRVNIKEDVTVDPAGTSYSGTFTIDIYPPSGGTTPVAHVAGQVTAQRVAAN
jgi:hypothetical protein